MPTTYNKATLATFFQTNDVPSGNDYENLIYSQINIVETQPQAMSGSLQATEFIAARISAGNANFTGTLTVFGQFSAKANFSVDSITASAASFSNTVSANRGFFNSDISVSGNASIGGNASISGNVSANNINIGGEFIRPVVSYSAAGTAQATATVISAGNSTLVGAVDGQTTGYRLMANKTGLVQFVYNQNTVSSNLWPCTGGQINVLASNAAFGMAASTLYTVLHTKASGYAVR